MRNLQSIVGYCGDFLSSIDDDIDGCGYGHTRVSETRAALSVLAVGGVSKNVVRGRMSVAVVLPWQMAEEVKYYEAEAIVGRRNNPLRYCVKWKGYSAADNTWEPAAGLMSCTHLIEEYEARQVQICCWIVDTASAALVQARIKPRIHIQESHILRRSAS